MAFITHPYQDLTISPSSGISPFSDYPRNSFNQFPSSTRPGDQWFTGQFFLQHVPLSLYRIHVALVALSSCTSSWTSPSLGLVPSWDPSKRSNPSQQQGTIPFRLQEPPLVTTPGSSSPCSFLRSLPTPTKQARAIRIQLVVDFCSQLSSLSSPTK